MLACVGCLTIFAAIKILPEHIAKLEDLRVRFEREARAAASLNHTNICVLHDIGSHTCNFRLKPSTTGQTTQKPFAAFPGQTCADRRRSFPCSFPARPLSCKRPQAFDPHAPFQTK